MNAPADPESLPTREWEDLLERVGLAAGAEPGVDRVEGAARCTRTLESPWTDRLVAGLAELELRASVVRGTADEAGAAVGPSHPVVYIDPSSGRWALVSDRRGRSLKVESSDAGVPQWMSPSELAERLGLQASASVEWVAVEPSGLLVPAALDGHGDSPPAPSPFARLRAVVRQERHDVAVVLVYAVGVGVLTLATPIAVQALVNTVAFGTLLQPLLVLTLLLLGGLVFAAVLRALQAWVVEVLQRRLFLRLVGDLAHRLPRVRLSAFDRAHGPELVNRFFDIFTIQKAAASLLLGGLDLVLTALVGTLVLAFYHPLLLAFDVLLLVLVLVILFVLGRGATKTAVVESKAKYEVAGWLEEIARHPIAFKLAGGPDLARQEVDRLAAKYLGARKKHFRVVFRQLLGALGLQAFASAGVLGIGGWLVIERQLTLGQLVAAELIVTAVVASFAKVGKHLETSYDLLAALDKVGQLVDLPLEAPAKTATLPTPSPRGTALDARGIELSFPDRGRVLAGLGLELEPGERVVIRGASGAGKSALVDVLAGLREPSMGRVRVDGVDVRDVHRETLRRRVAVVRGAEVVIGSIADNVAFGRHEIDPTAVRGALRAVGLLDEIEQLPEGLGTEITPTGAPLSSGQAVRLTLARALADEPSLLVVDGALDGLDERTLSHVLGALFAKSAPWTLLLISNDPAVATRCTRVLDLDDGRLWPAEETSR